MIGSSPYLVFPARFLLAGVAACLTVLPVFAAAPDKATAVGQPDALMVQPESIALSGRHARQQLFVTARYAGEVVRRSLPAMRRAMSRRGMATQPTNTLSAVL